MDVMDAIRSLYSCRKYIDVPVELDKIGIVLSALPIAIIANVTRIVATAVLAETVGSQAANVVFHDLAGWLMMRAM